MSDHSGFEFVSLSFFLDKYGEGASQDLLNTFNVR